MKVSWIVAFIITLWVGSASAATITSSGVTGLDVGGVLYDVAIGPMGGQTVGQIYGPYLDYGLSLDATDNPTLVAVNEALVALFIANSSLVGPTYFDGCDLAAQCILFSPTKIFNASEPGGALFATQSPQYTLGGSGPGWKSLGSTFANSVTAAPTNITFAYVSPSAVPLPAAAWLFISAIGGLVVAKRRQLKA